MCTVSWRIKPGGYEVFFNRDEQRSRPEAEAPKLWNPQDGGARFLAPVDPQAGGSWISVNEKGLCAAVLNYYGKDALGVSTEGGQSVRSRGLLLVDLAVSRGLAECIHGLENLLSEETYQPFILLALDARGDCRIRCWNGSELQVIERPSPCFLSTSSFEQDRVAQARKDAYTSFVSDLESPNPAALQAFHRWHDSRSPETSVLMSRPDARTVSLTQIELSVEWAWMDYFRVKDSQPPELELTVCEELPQKQAGRY
ncbi:MAG: NRDE family protein [Opitutales bacterium]|nr:NRDE family protein [Opitutales bacterium]